MSIFTASVSNFDLTSSWKIVLDKSGWVMSPTPNTGSADKTFDFTGIPAGSVINSATLTATMNSPATGAALRTVDGGSFSGSKGVSITAGGYNTFRFRFKANGTTSAPYGDRSSTLSFSDVTITVDYTPPGGGGGGAPPPATNIGTLSVSPSSITAGGSFLTTLGPAEAYITRHVSIYRNDNGAFLDSVVVSHGSGQDSWNYTVPIAWCEFAPNDTQFSLLIQLYAEKPGGLWGGVAYQTVNVLIPEDIKPTIGSLSASYNANGVNSAITNYVQNYSKTNLAMGSVSGAYGSSIIWYEITGGGFSTWSSSATLGPFSQTGNITFTAKVVDSRGRVGTKTVAINVEPYSPPAFSIPEGWRSNYDGVKNQKGTYVRLKSGVSFSSIGGQNAVSLKGRVYLKGGVAPAWSSMTPGQALILGGGALLFTKTYVAEIQISDLLESRVTEFIIPTKKTGLSIMAGMSGAAIGKSAETPGILDVAWPIVAPGLAPNPNLLHNPDFTNPINQRGVTSGYVPSYRYTYDRWMMSDGIWITVNLSVDFTAATGSLTPYVLQMFEMDMRGRTYTVSLDLYDYGIKTFVIDYPADGSMANVVWDGLLCAIQRPGSVDLLSISNYNTTKGFRIKRAKLELGTVSTIHLDPPMDWAVELAKCQRFFQIRSTNNVPAVDLSPSMRITPTVTGSGPYYYSADL